MMLTNEISSDLLSRLADPELRTAIPNKVIGDMARELLAFRTLPAMGEIDAERQRVLMSAGNRSVSWKGFEECVNALADLARRFAAALEAERKLQSVETEQLRMAVGCASTIKGDMVMRADDPLGMMQEVCSYVAALTRVRDDLKEAVKHWEEHVDALENNWKTLVEVARGERDEARRLLEWLNDMAGRGYCLEFLATCNNPESNINATRILELCKGGRDD